MSVALMIAFILVSSACIGYGCAGCRARWCRMALLLMAAASIVIVSESVGYGLHLLDHRDRMIDAIEALARETAVQEIERGSRGNLRLTVRDGAATITLNRHPLSDFYGVRRLPWIATWLAGLVALLLGYRARVRQSRSKPMVAVAPSPLAGEGGRDQRERMDEG